MAPIRQVCRRQLEIIVEFAEDNRAVVIGGYGKGPFGQREANKAWKALALRLNSLGQGLVKSPDSWKRYWHLLKCRAKAKAADLRRSREAGANKLNPLTDLEERIVAAIGKVAFEGIVQIPFDADVPELEVETEVEIKLETHTDSEYGEDVASTPGCSSMNVPAPSALPEQHGESDTTAPGVVDHSYSALPEQPAVSASAGGAIEAPGAEQSPSVPHGRRAPARSLHKRSRPRGNRDENVPTWAYELESRRLEVEERRLSMEQRRDVREERWLDLATRFEGSLASLATSQASLAASQASLAATQKDLIEILKRGQGRSIRHASCECWVAEMEVAIWNIMRQKDACES